MTFAPFCRSRGPMRWAVVGALAFMAVLVITPPSEKAYAANSWQKLSQAELTVIWWQWLYSIPASQSPALDDTGANAYNGQPYSDLLFLTGTLTSTEVSGDVLGHATLFFSRLLMMSSI